MEAAETRVLFSTSSGIAFGVLAPAVLPGVVESASQLVFVTQPVDAVAGTSSASITVDIESADGTLIAGDNSLITLTLTGGPVSGTATANAVNGVATFSERLFNLAGTYTLIASDMDNGVALTPMTSNSFTITPGPASQIAITNAPIILPGHPTNVNAALEDQYGNITTYDNSSPLTLSVNGPAGFGTTGAPETLAATAGAAAFQLALSVPGNYSFTVTGDNFTTSYTAGALAYTSPQLAFANYLGVITAGTKIPALNVALYNSSGLMTAKSKTKVSLIVMAAPTGARVFGSARAKPKNGIVAFKHIFFKTAGTYQLAASGSTFAEGFSTVFTVVAATAKKISFSEQPVPNPVTAGGILSARVSVFDKYKNAVDGSVVTLSLSGKAASVLSGVLSEPTVDGVADFDGLSLVSADDYTITAADGKLKAKSKKLVVD